MELIPLFAHKHIVLGVTGSIASYKAVDLASKLTQAGAWVDVIMTDAAQRFVTPLTFQAVTGRPVYTNLWQTESQGGIATHIAHVGVAESADLLAVIPATADTIAKLAHGFAHDFLSITALAARCPLIIAPAMDGEMYSHPLVQKNLEILRQHQAVIIEPEIGRFASGLVGQGRLPETQTLIGALRYTLSRQGALNGKKIIVTAGGTREALDPVRFITNRSSGKQGHALAQAALDAGAHVTLISSAKHLATPYGANLITVDSTGQMHDAVLEAIPEADALVMSAAVADFRPREVATQKIKKKADAQGLTLELEKTEDILIAVKNVREKTGFPRKVIGFAAESNDLLQNAQDKRVRKGVDLLVANDISESDAGFDVETNRVVLLTPEGNEPLELMSKAQVSENIIQRLIQMLQDER